MFSKSFCKKLNSACTNVNATSSLNTGRTQIIQMLKKPPHRQHQVKEEEQLSLSAIGTSPLPVHASVKSQPTHSQAQQSPSPTHANSLSHTQNVLRRSKSPLSALLSPGAHRSYQSSRAATSSEHNVSSSNDHSLSVGSHASPMVSTGASPAISSHSNELSGNVNGTTVKPTELILTGPKRPQSSQLYARQRPKSHARLHSLLSGSLDPSLPRPSSASSVLSMPVIDTTLLVWGSNIVGQCGTGMSLSSVVDEPTVLRLPSTVVQVAATRSSSWALDIAGRAYVWGAFQGLSSDTPVSVDISVLGRHSSTVRFAHLACSENRALLVTDCNEIILLNDADGDERESQVDSGRRSDIRRPEDSADDADEQRSTDNESDDDRSRDLLRVDSRQESDLNMLSQRSSSSYLSAGGAASHRRISIVITMPDVSSINLHSTKPVKLSNPADTLRPYSLLHAELIHCDVDVRKVRMSDTSILLVDSDNICHEVLRSRMDPSLREVRRIPGIDEPVCDICMSDYHSLFLTVAGNVYASGTNEFGALGLPIRGTIHTPQLVRFFRDHSLKVRAIACGTYHSLFLSDNAMFSCGSNDDGQCGWSRRAHVRWLPTRVHLGKDPFMQVTAHGICSYVWTRDMLCRVEYDVLVPVSKRISRCKLLAFAIGSMHRLVLAEYPQPKRSGPEDMKIGRHDMLDVEQEREEGKNQRVHASPPRKHFTQDGAAKDKAGTATLPLEPMLFACTPEQIMQSCTALLETTRVTHPALFRDLETQGLRSGVDRKYGVYSSDVYTRFSSETDERTQEHSFRKSMGEMLRFQETEFARSVDRASKAVSGK